MVKLIAFNPLKISRTKVHVILAGEM